MAEKSSKALRADTLELHTWTPIDPNIFVARQKKSSRRRKSIASALTITLAAKSAGPAVPNFIAAGLLSNNLILRQSTPSAFTYARGLAP